MCYNTYRERDASDRRLVNTTITRDGLRLLKVLDALALTGAGASSVDPSIAERRHAL